MESGTQKLVNSFSQGAGVKALRVLLFMFLTLGIFGAYYSLRFRGLKDPSAMESAQLARGLAQGQGFRSLCLRPADLRMPRDSQASDGFADVRQAPLYPLLLSWCFRLLRPGFETAGDSRIFDPEKKAIVPLGIFFSIATAGLVFLLARRLFNGAVALASTLVFVTTDGVLQDSISGTALPLITLLATATIWFAATAVANRNRERRFLFWMMPLVLCGLSAGLAFLAGYRMLVLAPVLAAFIWLTATKGGPAMATVAVVIALATATPWLIRNRNVSGHLLGSAPYACLNNTTLYEGNSFDRSLNPDMRSMRVVPALKLKFASNLRRFYDFDLRTIGGGFAICLFLVSFFVPRDNRVAQALGWSMGMGLLLLLAACAFRGSAQMLRALLPVIIVCAAGFAFELVEEKTGWPDAYWQPVLTIWLVALTAAPMMLNLFGTRPSTPYPPYFPPFANYVCGLLEPDETLSTDIPWATAWYGNRRSLLLPRDSDELLRIHTNGLPLAGIYLTTETGDKAYTRMLVEGPEKSWLPLLNRKVPEDFPFKFGINIPPDSRDQIFITDKIRW